MKTIKELAKEYNVSYKAMWDRLTKLRRQLERAGDERAGKLIRKRTVTFGSKDRVLIDETILKQVLEELS